MEFQETGSLLKCNTLVISKFENIFYWYGKMVAKRPWHFIFSCIFITVLCSLGVMNFTKENRPFKLWIPQDSDFIRVMEWQLENFPQKFRIHVALYEAENVLTKKVLLEMLRVHNTVAEASTQYASWNSTCAKLPAININLFGRKKRELKNKTLPFPSLKERKERQAWLLPFLSREEYCYLLESIPEECMEHSILEVWGYNEATLNSLNEDDIINDINKAKTSAVFGFPSNFTQYLGGIEKNAEGFIVKAKAMQHIWITKVDEEEVEKGNYINDEGIGMVVDRRGFEWEKELIKNVLNDSQRPQGINIYLMASSSFGIIAGSTIKNDVKYLAIGFCIVFLYVVVMLGKFNMIEQRPLLSLSGISCVWLSIGVSYGLCSLFSLPFGPVNNVLPFLLLGLGIDDMFVVIQSWNNLDSQEKKHELHVRIGLALKHAGVSITITSLTDFVAFAIGSTTVLPALRSFCLYAALGIISVYFFQVTFFVAWLALDQKRLEDSRHGLLWCIKLKNWTPNSCSQRDLCQSFFTNVYSNILLKTPSKVFVFVFTAGLIGVSVWGLINLKQEFNPIWFLPHSSYLFNFFMKREEYFASDGEDGIVFFGNINLNDNLPKIDYLVENLKNSDHISQIDSWYSQYKTYWDSMGYDVLKEKVNDTVFSDQLSEFLYSPSGSKYRVKNFRFNGTFNCTASATDVLASSIEYKHHILHTSSDKIRAMEGVKNIVKSLNFSGYVQPWARMYSGWETDKIIKTELYRNLLLALTVVFFMTLLMIVSFMTSCMILLCVAMTLVDVGALMHWWGLTIDTVSCIDLVLAVGLCVDYAAHVGHTFMTQRGSRNDRVKNTLTRIGPAVLNGGFSTFLAFVLLGASDSHVFKSFFKIFFAVTLYGLYHGLVFLPVLLSVIGPASYGSPAVATVPAPNNEQTELCLMPKDAGNEMNRPVALPQDEVAEKETDNNSEQKETVIF